MLSILGLCLCLCLCMCIYAYTDECLCRWGWLIFFIFFLVEFMQEEQFNDEPDDEISSTFMNYAIVSNTE